MVADTTGTAAAASGAVTAPAQASRPSTAGNPARRNILLRQSSLLRTPSMTRFPSGPPAAGPKQVDALAAEAVDKAGKPDAGS